MKRQNSLFISLLRGIFCRCPNCGRGKLFKSFLKTHHECVNCKEELFHHQADDMPAYFVITIVGHIVVPMILWCVINYDLEEWQHLAIWTPLSILLAFLLFQPVKGCIINLQWHYFMHDFAKSKK